LPRGHCLVHVVPSSTNTNYHTSNTGGASDPCPLTLAFCVRSNTKMSNENKALELGEDDEDSEDLEDSNGHLLFAFDYEQAAVVPVKLRVRAKKGHADPSQWKRNSRKRKTPKDIGPCICANGCFTKIRSSQRTTLRRDFEALSRSEQQIHMAGLVEVKKRKHISAAMSVRRRRAREFESVYHLKSGGQLMRVCKHAFKSILGVQGKL
jgi:hypothetical protein